MKRVVHCWESGPVHYKPDEHPAFDVGVGSMCMLLLDHDGPHKFTRNDDIRVKFPA